MNELGLAKVSIPVEAAARPVGKVSAGHERTSLKDMSGLVEDPQPRGIIEEMDIPRVHVDGWHKSRIGGTQHVCSKGGPIDGTVIGEGQ